MHWIKRLWDRAKQRTRPQPLAEWFFASFDAETVRLRVELPQKLPWEAECRWAEIERIRFIAEDFVASDEIHLVRSGGSSLVVPTEAAGGSALWDEINRRGLFDPLLAREAVCSLGGVYSWPPDAASAT